MPKAAKFLSGRRPGWQFLLWRTNYPDMRHAAGRLGGKMTAKQQIGIVLIHLTAIVVAQQACLELLRAVFARATAP